MINNRYLKLLIFSVVSVILFLTPILVMGNNYFVGGDDTRLYYIYPELYLNNFAVNIISDNALGGANTGYNTAQHFIPFLLVISLLKKLIPFINVQWLMYGLNYSLGFLFFYLFLRIWLKSDKMYSFISLMVAGLLYIFSPFLVGSLYKTQIAPLYLVSLMPAILYFFCKGVLERKYIYAIIAVVIYSIFSTTLNVTPWFLPIIITGVPLLMYLFVKDKYSFVINTLTALVFVLALNSFWIFHFVYSNISNRGIASSSEYYSTEEYRKANISGILNLSTIMNPLVPVVQSVDFKFKQNFTFNRLRNLIFILIIIYAGILVAKKKNHDFEKIYWLSLSAFLISWFLFSPNIGKWGPKYFLQFVTNIPFGIMFRNMYDKFALPLSFYYSFSLAIALVIFGQESKKIVKMIVIILVFGVTLSNSHFFFNPKIKENGVNAMVSGVFNDDFTQMVDYLNKLENPSRILWLPITAPNYVTIEDKYLQGHYYSGLSPLRILANRGDYAGRYSFMLPKDVFYGDKIFKMLVEKDYEKFATEMQELNVRYIILDKQHIPDEMKSYLYDEDKKYLRLQDQEYKDFILGQIIKDFGDRYSIYQINERFMNDKIYLTDNYDSIPVKFEGITYKKQSSYLYSIQINDLSTPKKLVFLEPFSKKWILFNKNNYAVFGYKKESENAVNGWANGWEIIPSEIIKYADKNSYKLNPDGSIDIDLQIYFVPQSFNKWLSYLSLFTYLLAFIPIIVYLATRNRKSKVRS